MSTDEAGFDVLIGSDEARVLSALYNEKAYIMSKNFIKTAFLSRVQGLDSIINWLYLDQANGPRLLRRVVEDARALISNAEVGIHSTHGDKEMARTKFSEGALILLKRNLEWLEDFLRNDEKANGKDS